MKIYIDRMTKAAVGASAPSALYLEIKVGEGFQLEKTIEEQQGEKQKTNDQGQLIYKANLVVDGDQETYDETTDSKIAVEFQEVTKTITIDDEPQEVTVQEPIAWEELAPVMVPNLVPKLVNIKDQPEAFTLDEVLEAKYRDVLEASSQDFIIADSFLEESDLDLEDPQHSANTGMGICEILPGGQAKTKTINLAEAAATFTLLELDADPGVEIYIAGQAFVDGVAILTNPVASCTIKFMNTTDKPKAARAYAIGY